MTRTKLLQEVKRMRFGEVYVNWKKGSLTQEEAGRIPGVSGRTFRRYIDNYDEDNPESIDPTPFLYRPS